MPYTVENEIATRNEIRHIEDRLREALRMAIYDFLT